MSLPILLSRERNGDGQRTSEGRTLCVVGDMRATLAAALEPA